MVPGAIPITSKYDINAVHPEFKCDERVLLLPAMALVIRAIRKWQEISNLFHLPAHHGRFHWPSSSTIGSLGVVNAHFMIQWT